jgi:hypothetical protein
MKGTISKNARTILNDPKAADKLMNCLLNYSNDKFPVKIEAGGKTFMVSPIKDIQKPKKIASQSLWKSLGELIKKVF